MIRRKTVKTSWGAKQASIEYNELIGKELGCDGIEIDWHSNPRPSHEFMQGKQYSLDGKKTVNGKTFEDAAPALKALNDYGYEGVFLRYDIGKKQSTLRGDYTGSVLSCLHDPKDISRRK